MAKTPFSYSALAAKCRAKSSKLLGFSDYEALSSMKSLSEAAAFIAERGDYSKELSGNIYGDIDRRRLEELFARALSRICDELVTFSGGEIKPLMNAIVKKYEISGLLHRARSVSMLEGDDGAYLAELKNSLKGTPYYKSVSEHIQGGKLQYARLESALYSGFYSELIAAAHSSGDETVTEIIQKAVDFRNVDIIIRARRNFGLSSEAILPYLLGVDGGLDRKELARLCAAPKEELYPYLTHYFGMAFDEGNYSGTNHRNRYLYEYYRKTFSETKPSFGVVLAFVGLCETEVSNLIHITEGIRYGLSPEEIMKCVASKRPG